MSRHHGITSGTYEDHFVVDSGAVYKDYGEATEAIIGATRGGNTFTITTEYRDIPVDGARGKVKGATRIIGITAEIKANIVELSSALIGYALPGSDSAALGATHTKWTRSLQIATADYWTNVALVGEVKGSTNPIVLVLSNPIADGGFELAFNDKDESVLAVTFSAHFDPSDLDTEPWEIRWPAS